jgi:hypothetical protein
MARTARPRCLGMRPLAAFPIKMGSCAFLMPVGALRFIRGGRYSARVAPGLTLGASPVCCWPPTS